MGIGGDTIINAIVDVCVQAIFIDTKVEYAHAHFFGRSVTLGNRCPARCINRLRTREGRLPCEAGRVIVLEAKRGYEVRQI